MFSVARTSIFSGKRFIDVSKKSIKSAKKAQTQQMA